MKALECSEQRTLSLVEKPVPMPTEGLVRIKVGYAGLCHSDQAIISGTIKLKANFPVTLGHEGCGEVDAVGSTSDEKWLGKKVVWETTFTRCEICVYCLSGEYNLCATRKIVGYSKDGTFSEFVIVPTRNLWLVPEPVPYHSAVIAEPLACVMRGLSKIAVGDNVGITGPGPIGALTALVLQDHKPVLFGPKRVQHRLDIIASQGITTKTIEEADQCEGQVDTFIECSGGKGAVGLGLRLLKRKGTFLQIGLPQEEIIDWSLVAYHELVVRGSISSNQVSWRQALYQLGLIDVRPLLSPPYRLEDWENAFQAAREGQHIKVVFKM